MLSFFNTTFKISLRSETDSHGTRKIILEKLAQRLGSLVHFTCSVIKSFHFEQRLTSSTLCTSIAPISHTRSLSCHLATLASTPSGPTFLSFGPPPPKWAKVELGQSRARPATDELLCPDINVDGCETKSMSDNVHGCRHLLLDVPPSGARKTYRELLLGHHCFMPLRSFFRFQLPQPLL